MIDDFINEQMKIESFSCLSQRCLGDDDRTKIACASKERLISAIGISHALSHQVHLQGPGQSQKFRNLLKHCSQEPRAFPLEPVGHIS